MWGGRCGGSSFDFAQLPRNLVVVTPSFDRLSSEDWGLGISRFVDTVLNEAMQALILGVAFGQS
jgi:hypothetical protein